MKDLKYLKNLVVNVHAIDWDTDGEEVDDLPTELEIPFSFDDLTLGGVLAKTKDGYTFDENALEDAVGNYLSDTYGYCHYGFSIDYNMVF